MQRKLIFQDARQTRGRIDDQNSNRAHVHAGEPQIVHMCTRLTPGRNRRYAGCMNATQAELDRLMRELPKPRTPATIAPEIERLCAEIAPGVVPAYLDVEPIPGAAESDCTTIVEQHVTAHGGERVLGWQIWEQAQVLVEAEFHAVWRDPAGQMHDLTPKPAGISRILFLADSAVTYGGTQINNVRKPLRDTPTVRSFIQAMDDYYEFTNRGDRATFHGNLLSILSDAEKAELANLGRRQFEVMRAVVAELKGLGPGVDKATRNARKRARRSRR